MDEHSGRQRREAKGIGGDLIIPVSALALTVYYFTTIIGVPWSAQVSAFFIGTILILLIIALFIRTAFALRRGEVSLRLGRVIEPVSLIPKRIVLLVLTLGYILFILWGAGFTLTTFAFLALAMLLLSEGRKKGFVLILSTVLAIGGWLLFIVAFETRFPAGPFEWLMKGMF